MKRRKSNKKTVNQKSYETKMRINMREMIKWMEKKKKRSRRKRKEGE